MLGSRLRAVDATCSGFTFRLEAEGFSILDHAYWLVQEIVGQNQYNISPENVKDKIIMDVGAHIGIFSLLTARMGARKVHAFEPVTATYEILDRNIEINGLRGVISPVNKAAGDYMGTSRVCYSYAGDDCASLHRKSRSPHVEQECEVTTVDGFVEAQSVTPDLIKIDVKGVGKEGNS